MNNTTRIAKNTLALYFRQILIMIVSLYTVRVVLNTLGAEDYGIYNVVAGVVTMFSFLSGAMATASQRFFSFEMGKGNEAGLAHIFSVTLTIYAFLSVIIVIFAETLGLWFVCTKLVIPLERMTAAKWIYQCAVISFLFTIMTTPYMSTIIAHENMNVYAYVSIVEVVLKLAVVFVLKVVSTDKLILYGILLLFVAIINTGLYRFYCKRHYKECKFKLRWDRKLYSEMFSFTSWTLFGQFTGIIRNQAVTVLINQFFNPVVVAARSIAQQVTNAVSVFSSNFNTSLYPPIIKEYSIGNKEEMFRLVNNGSKMTFFLMWFFTLPLLLHLDFVLDLWLKEVPKWTVLFTRLSLVDVLINSLGFPLQTAARAPGKMRTYELTLGIMQLLIFPVSLVLFRMEFAAWSAFAVSITATVFMMVARLILVKSLVGIPIGQFFIKTILPLFMMMMASLGIVIGIRYLLPVGNIFILGQIVFSVPVSCATMFFIGFNREHRKQVIRIIKNKLMASNHDNNYR